MGRSLTYPRRVATHLKVVGDRRADAVEPTSNVALHPILSRPPSLQGILKGLQKLREDHCSHGNLLLRQGRVQGHAAERVAW